MKGIKECLNWMLDNPMKVIESKNQYWSYRYNDIEFRFELKSVRDEKEKFRNAGCFQSLENSDWQEVIEPVDFITAYKDCLENGTEYKGFSKWDERYGEVIMRKESGNEVWVLDYDGQANVHLNCKWIKVG